MNSNTDRLSRLSPSAEDLETKLANLNNLINKVEKNDFIHNIIDDYNSCNSNKVKQDSESLKVTKVTTTSLEILEKRVSKIERRLDKLDKLRVSLDSLAEFESVTDIRLSILEKKIEENSNSNINNDSEKPSNGNAAAPPQSDDVYWKFNVQGPEAFDCTKVQSTDSACDLSNSNRATGSRASSALKSQDHISNFSSDSYNSNGYNSTREVRDYRAMSSAKFSQRRRYNNSTNTSNYRRGTYCYSDSESDDISDYESLSNRRDNHNDRSRSPKRESERLQKNHSNLILNNHTAKPVTAVTKSATTLNSTVSKSATVSSKSSTNSNIYNAYDQSPKDVIRFPTKKTPELLTWKQFEASQK